jgi:two-component system, sensor histidine kinase and response regulator
MARLFDPIQQQLLEALATGIVGLDADGRCRFVNRAGLRLLNRDAADDLLGQPVDEIIRWAARGDLPAFADCLARLKRGESHAAHSDHEALVRDGEAALSVEVDIQAIASAEEFLGCLVMLHDITDRSRQAKAFHASVKSFRALFDNVPEAIFFLTRQGKVVDSNSGVQRIYGIAQHSFIGKSIDNIVAPGREAASLLSQQVAAVFEDGMQRLDFWSRGRERKEFPAEIYLYPADYFGQRVVMAMVHDITDRKRHEAAIIHARDQAEQASRMKSQFMSNMSHEFRTPLNGIIGMADLLAETGLNHEQSEYTRSVQENGRNLLGIVNNLLDLARLESRQFKRSDAEFFLPGMLEDIERKYTPACQAKDLELAIELDAALDDVFHGDDAILGRILTNLVDNAVKFTPRGRIVLSAAPLDTAAPDGQTAIRFAVRDTGIGIRAEKCATIFEPFVQGDGSATRSYGGLGVGLSIAHYLVATLGGTLAVASEIEVGSTFHFDICLKRDA